MTSLSRRSFAAGNSARKHSDARIEKILGKNLVRVFSETWKA